jgi:hypothetical protein
VTIDVGEAEMSIVGRSIACLCVALPVVLAVPAWGEPPPTLRNLSGHQLVNLSVSGGAVDGSCGDSSEIGPPFEDAHQVFDTDIVKPHDWESLGINICWFNTTANGGDSVDTGTWELYRENAGLRAGTLGGRVTGGVTSSHTYIYELTLHIVRATGIFSGLSGHLVFWTCGGYGGLRTNRPHRLPAACLP